MSASHAGDISSDVVGAGAGLLLENRLRVDLLEFGSSTTLTLMPVSFSHSGPVILLVEQCLQPRLGETVIVVPANCLAASTALAAALSCALAAPAVASVPTVAANSAFRSMMSPSLGSARARSRLARCETQAALALDRTRSPCAGGGRMPGSRPSTRSASTRPEPQASVQPRCPWPALTQRLSILVRPMTGVPVGRHRPQSGPEPRGLAIEVARQLRKGLSGVGDDGLAPGVGRRGVVAGDLGRAGDAHPVADRHQAEQLAVVDHRHLRRAVPAAAREGDRQPLHRIDRHVDADGAQQWRR